MIGSRIYIDFGRFDFEIACEKLMTEISLQRKKPLPAKAVQLSYHETPMKTTPNQPQISAQRREQPVVIDNNRRLSPYLHRRPMSHFTRKPITQWTESDVLDFLFTQRLIELMPLCEAMDGRALIQLYKMCISRSSKTYALLNDELKSTYKTKLPLGIYTRFLSVMEQRLTTRPSAPLPTRPTLPVRTVTTIPQQYVAPLPTRSILPVKKVTTIPQQYVAPPPKASIINNVTVEYPAYADKSCDLIITSDAPAIEVLRTVLRYSSHYEKISSLRTQNSGRF
jgi:hypothetical protein